MKNILKNSSSGFTLVEMLTAMLIFSSVTISMLFMFNKINIIFYEEAERAELLNYGNLLLNELTLAITKTNDVLNVNKNGRNITILTTSECRFEINSQNGFSIDYNKEAENRGNKDKVYNFTTKDYSGRKNYSLNNFKIEGGLPPRTVAPIRGLEGYGSADIEARYGSRIVSFNITEYSITGDTPSRTLYFSRRVYSPGNDIYLNELFKEKDV